MTSVHAIEPERAVRGAVDRKPLKCFPICRADSADPDSQTPIPHWLIFSPTLFWPFRPLSFPHNIPFSPRSVGHWCPGPDTEAGSLMISPSSRHSPASGSCLPLLNFVKLSPRRTFSLCPPAAYQRPESPAPPPACLCRPGWTRAGRFSEGLWGLSGTRRYRRECPGQRGERRRLRV